MSRDGRTMWMLYSGLGGNNYAFILRRLPSIWRQDLHRSDADRHRLLDLRVVHRGEGIFASAKPLTARGPAHEP